MDADATESGACTNVCHTNKNDISRPHRSGPYASRRKTYVPPAFGIAAPSSDHTKASSVARSAPASHAMRACGPPIARITRELTTNGQFPGYSSDGRAAGPHRVAGGSAPGDAGRLCVVRAGRRDAEGGGHVRLSARGIRPGAVGPADVVFVRMANVGAGPAFRGVGVHWFRKVRRLSVPLHTPASEGNLRGTRHLYCDPPVPPHHHDRKNLCPAVDWRCGNDAVADLGRGQAFRCQDRI